MMKRLYIITNYICMMMFVFISCGKGSSGITCTSIKAVEKNLSAAKKGSNADDPLPLKVKIDLQNTLADTSGWKQLLDAINTAGKYVRLDLSACTMPNTEFNPNPAFVSGKQFIVSLTLPDKTESIPAMTKIQSTSQHLELYNIRIDTTITAPVFFGCTGLTSVTFPPGVTSIGSGAFKGCTSLTSITIPSRVTAIESNAFEECTGLTSVAIPSSVTAIGSDAFKGCTGLTSITIPSGVTSIEGGAFSGCTGLASVTIPSGVTSIGDIAFKGCTSLTSITIPSSVTSLYETAFLGCTGLTNITFDAGPSIREFGYFNSEDMYNRAQRRTAFVPVCQNVLFLC